MNDCTRKERFCQRCGYRACMAEPKEQARFDVEEIFRTAEAQRLKRAATMPSEADCLRVMMDVYQRLQELGWREAIYCPKDGTAFEAIEAGSTGIFRCHYSGTWPDGSWWAEDGGDLRPSRPILLRPLSASSDLEKGLE